MDLTWISPTRTTPSTLHHLANKVHMAAWPREKKGRKGMFAVSCLWCSLMPFFFTAAFASDHASHRGTLSPGMISQFWLRLLLLAWTLWTRQFCYACALDYRHSAVTRFIMQFICFQELLYTLNTHRRPLENPEPGVTYIGSGPGMASLAMMLTQPQMSILVDMGMFAENACWLSYKIIIHEPRSMFAHAWRVTRLLDLTGWVHRFMAIYNYLWDSLFLWWVSSMQSSIGTEC